MSKDSKNETESKVSAKISNIMTKMLIPWNCF